MDIIVKSLYSNRDIFIRELISNAADACDKIRYQALTDPTVLGDQSDLEIKARKLICLTALTATDPRGQGEQADPHPRHRHRHDAC